MEWSRVVATTYGMVFMHIMNGSGRDGSLITPSAPAQAPTWRPIHDETGAIDDTGTPRKWMIAANFSFETGGARV